MQTAIVTGPDGEEIFPDQYGRYGPFGGRYVPETLIPALPPILRPDDGLDGVLVIDPPEGLLDVAGD